MQQRQSLVAQHVHQAPGSDERVQDLEQLRPVEPAAAPGAQDQLADVARSPNADVGPPPEQIDRLVGLVERSLDHERVGGRHEALGQPPRRRESRVVGQPRPDQRELEQLLAARVHQALTLRQPTRYRRVAGQPEAQRSRDPFAGIVHADPRPNRNRGIRHGLIRRSQPQLVAGRQVVSVEASIDSHRLAESRRT